MKSTCWPAMVLACLLLLVVPGAVVGDAGSDYLDLKEQQVVMMASAAEENFGRRCDLLKVCAPTLLADANGSVDEYMATSNTSFLDLSRSYITGGTILETKVDITKYEISEAALDPLMKDIAFLNDQSTTQSRPFFGAIDGTWRAFLGFTDQSATLSFDPRIRPWYRTSTSVVKVVVLLIDLSPSMANHLPPHIGTGTLLEAAKNIAFQLLFTLNEGDYVNIVIFDGTRIVQLAPSSVLVRSQTTTMHGELDLLKVELSKFEVFSQTNYKPSNLNATILAALPNFDSNSQAAKVILVITDGVFATFGNITLPSSKLTGVKIFLYKLPQSNDILLTGNTLIKELCIVGGHFESFLDLKNPLLGFHKYFSYLANLKDTLTGKRPQYSFVHQDLEQIGGNIILVTKPVFWNNDLIGVVGLTIYIELLGSLTDAVNQALQSKITRYNVPTTSIVLSAANCTIVDFTLGALSDCEVSLPKIAREKINIANIDSYIASNKGHLNFKNWGVVVGSTLIAVSILIGFIFLRRFWNQAFHRKYVSREWSKYHNELEYIEGDTTKFIDYDKLYIYVTSVHKTIEEAIVSPLQLNGGQCKILAQELDIVRDFLLAKKDQCTPSRNEMKALRHLYYAIQKAKFLIEKCCCHTPESWIVSAMALVDIQEGFVAIILDLQLWRMVLDIVITSTSGASRDVQKERLMIMDEKYEELYKKLHKSNDDLQQAAFEDKRNVILRLNRLQEAENDLEYLRVIYLLNWLDELEDEAQNPNPIYQGRLTNYDDRELLGKGTYGKVYRVTWLGLHCALKKLVERNEREAMALKGLLHPNIIWLYYYWEAPESHLMMELMDMDLDVYIKRLMSEASFGTCKNDNKMPFSIPVAIDIMLQVAHAMQYMHKRHLTHRDLKPKNVLVKLQGEHMMNFSGESYLEIKLADFGTAKAYKNTESDSSHKKMIGTSLYGAPEIFGRDLVAERNFPPMADVWSFGVTCAQILSGKEPYAGTEGMGTLQSKIANEKLRPSLPKCCPPFLAFCISSCWEFKPQRRPNFASISKMLRYAKLLSLNLTNLDNSKMFLGYTTHRNCVKGFSTNT